MFKYLFLIFTLCSLSTLTQQADYPYVVVDRFYTGSDMQWTNYGFQLKNIHESKNDIEIRLNIYLKTGVIQEVITVKDGKYDANLYSKTSYMYSPDITLTYPDSIKKYGKWDIHPTRKFHVEGKDLKSICSKLLTFHIKNLPDENAIYKKPFLTNHFLECKINDKFYTCHFGQKKELDGSKLLTDLYPDVQAFKDYAHILDTFDDLVFDITKTRSK